MCPSGPIPSRCRSNAPWAARWARTAVAYSAAASTGSGYSPSEVATVWIRAGSTGTWSSRARWAWSSLRSGSPAGTKRSSPQNTSSLDQSRAPGASRTFSSRAIPVPPPVTTTDAEPRSACAATRISTNSRAAAVVRASPSAWISTAAAELVVIGNPFDSGQGLGIDLVRVQSAQFLGQAVAGLTAPQRDSLHGVTGAGQGGGDTGLRTSDGD